jgi:hypothetical protein
LNWGHSFSHFLAQPVLIEKHLAKFSDEIEDFAKTEYDVVDQAALLWKLIHYMILNYRDNNPGWIFKRHMDLSRDPIDNFQAIFNQLQLSFSEQEKRIIQNHNVRNSTDKSKDPYSISRNSGRTIKKWKDILTSEEIGRIRESVEEVSHNFFNDEDW